MNTTKIDGLKDMVNTTAAPIANPNLTDLVQTNTSLT